MRVNMELLAEGHCIPRNKGTPVSSNAWQGEHSWIMCALDQGNDL